MFSGLLMGAITVLILATISVVVNRQTLPGLPDTVPSALLTAAIIAIVVGLLRSHGIDHAYGNFLGLFLGYLAAQRLLMR